MKSEIMITESTQNRLQPASNGANDESLVHSHQSTFQQLSGITTNNQIATKRLAS